MLKEIKLKAFPKSIYQVSANGNSVKGILSMKLVGSASQSLPISGKYAGIRVS